MERKEGTPTGRKGKHLTHAERVVIENLLGAGASNAGIAQALGRHRRTIQRERVRGRVQHWDLNWRQGPAYSSDRGQQTHDLNGTARGPQLKLGANRTLVEFVRQRILDHQESPDVVAFRMRDSGLEGAVCTKTLYNYIDQGLIAGVSNQTLWQKRHRRHRTRRTLHRAHRRPALRQSIEHRPPQILQREEFGHWEIDLIAGPARGSPAALLTLVERKTRHLICRKLPDKSQIAVLRVLRSLERECGPRRFRQQFKSITADNGSEFLDAQRLQTSAFSRRRRTSLFYAHPYAAWERGSNENANKIIRRFIAKGSDIARLTHHDIHTLSAWINQYPRKILDYKASSQCFSSEIQSLPT